MPFKAKDSTNRKENPPSPALPRLAVLSAEGLWRAGDPGDVATFAPAALPKSLGDAFALLQAGGLTDLWIHDLALAKAGLPAGAPALDWLTFAGFANLRAPGTDWYWQAHAEGGGPVLSVAIPAWNWRGLGRWFTWRQVPTARLLFNALQLFQRHLGILPIGAPAQTGEVLFRRVHDAANGLRFAPASFPSVITKGEDETGTDLAWYRPLTPEERRRPFLVVFDRRSAYLGATSSLRCGLESPHHRAGPLSFDSGVAGYWRAAVTYAPLRQLPLPFPAGEVRWYTTPALTLFEGIGAGIHVEEAWLFPHSARPFEPWYAKLRAMREALEDPQDLAPRAALGAAKEIYKAFIGALGSLRWDRSKDALYRPDWRAFIIDQARANLWRRLLQAQDARPCLVHLDEVGFASHSKSYDALPPEWRALTGLAAFDHYGTFSLPSLLGAWDDSLGATIREIQRQKHHGAGSL